MRQNSRRPRTKKKKCARSESGKQEDDRDRAENRKQVSAGFRGRWRGSFLCDGRRQDLRLEILLFNRERRGQRNGLYGGEAGFHLTAEVAGCLRT